MTKPTWPPAGRIPYLDGLRAYSISTVILGHLSRFFPWLATRAGAPVNTVFANSRLGVRVFFVLSGFLITTLLLNELEATGTISIRGFYERRIARIFPAFYTYLSVILILILLHLVDINWITFTTAATYTWNYGILWGAPSLMGAQLLGHLWTLSLEEQFYIVWPACLIFLGRRWAERVAVVCVLLLPLVRLASYFCFPTIRGQLGMMFHTSADQILWGGLAAFAARRGAIDRVGAWKYRSAIPWLSGLVIFVVCPLLSNAIRGMELCAVPTLECVSIIAFIFWLLCGDTGLLRRGLESWPMVQIGLLSYSLYLWQQPFVFWDGVSGLWLPLKPLAALAAAIISYRVVEIPCRKRIRQWFSQSQPAH